MSLPRRIAVAALPVALLAWTIGVMVVGPSALVARLGATNGYAIAFLIASVGGISSLTGPSFLATVVALAAGGLSPVKLGIAAGLGATLSDAVFFVLGRAGRRVAPKRLQHPLEALSAWLRARPRWLVPVVVLFYTATLPLPSDIIIGALGLARIPFRRVALPLLVGNCIFLTWLAHVARMGGPLFT